MATCSAALFQSKKLLSAEGLVMDLACRFDEVLEMGAGKEISQGNKFAVALIFHIDNSPAVLASTNRLTVDDNGPLASNNCKRDYILVDR